MFTDQLWLCGVQLGLLLSFALLFNAAGFQETHINLVGKDDLVILFRRLEGKDWIRLVHVDVSVRRLARHGFALRLAICFAWWQRWVLHATLHRRLPTEHMPIVQRDQHLIIITIGNDFVCGSSVIP